MGAGRHNDALRAQLKLINEWKEETAIISAPFTPDGKEDDVYLNHSGPIVGERGEIIESENVAIPKAFFSGMTFHDEDDLPVTMDDDFDLFMDSVQYDVINVLEQGDTYYVTNEMCAVIGHAMESIPEGEMLHETDLLTKRGFVYFERPITYFVENHPVRAIAWHPMEVRVGNEYKNGVGLYVWREPTPGSVTYTGEEEVPSTSLVMVYIRGWAYGHTWHVDPDHGVGCEDDCEHGGEANHPTAAAFKRMLLTMWRTMSELVWVVASQRQTRRQAERKTSMPNPGQIRVVQLRRADYMAPARVDHGDGEARHYTHRWEVKGHWRNQWYPSERIHKRIWITKYIKGPEGKPLVLKDRIFKLER